MRFHRVGFEIREHEVTGSRNTLQQRLRAVGIRRLHSYRRKENVFLKSEPTGIKKAVGFEALGLGLCGCDDLHSTLRNFTINRRKALSHSKSAASYTMSTSQYDI